MGAPEPSNATAGRGLGDVVGRVARDAERAASAARVEVDARLERSPYATLGLAVAAGYVIGGGLFTPLTARLVGASARLGLRLLVLPLIEQELAGAARGALGLEPPSA